MFIILLVFIAAILAGMTLFARKIATSFVYPPHTLPEISPADFGLNAETVHFQASDGTEIAAWYIAPRRPQEGALIFVHGLGGNRSNLLQQASLIYQELGYGALLIDLRNHGESGGHQSTFGYLESGDVQASINYLLTQKEINPQRIGLVGFSLGAVSVLRAAGSTPEVRLVVAEASFAALGEFIGQSFQTATQLPDLFFARLVTIFGQIETGVPVQDTRPIDNLATIAPRPILFIHGDADEVISFQNSQALYAAASEPKSLVIVPGASHTDLLSLSPEFYRSHLIPFLEAYLG